MSFSSLFSFHAFSGNKPNLVTNATLAPINVTLLSNTATSITVSFTPPGGTVTGYTPYVNGVAATGSGTPASYTITGLSGGTSYNIVIYASMSFSTTSSGSFLPTSIPGSLLWLDAADTATITTSGSNVTQWNDKSGNGYNFTQGTTASQPTYSAMANGKNAINLATSKFMVNTSVAFPTNYTVFAVGYTSVTGYTRLLSSYPDVYLYFGTGNTAAQFATYVGNGSNWLDGYPNVTAISVSSLSLMELTNNNTSTGLIPYINGTAQNAKNGTTATFTGLLLGEYVGGSQYWSGYVAEVLIYNSVLTTTQRQQVEGYLAWKWGLQASLPIAHTYYSAAPTATSVVTKTYTSDGSIPRSLATKSNPAAAFTNYNSTTTNGAYTIYAYTTVGTYTNAITITAAVGLVIQIFAVAGGGSGGEDQGGGGGAGGVLQSSITISGSDTVSLTLGDGGPGTGAGANGSNTTVGFTTNTGNSMTCVGGGRGAGFNSGVGSGGSGGGGSFWRSRPAGTGTASQGNSGGTYGTSYGANGGGGGAGAVGAAGTGTTNAGNGGDGIQINTTLLTYFAGSTYANYWWAGGGGGGGSYTNVYGGNGGKGGGGGGSANNYTAGTGDTNGINTGGNGTVGIAQTGGAGGTNTGGGGGGSSQSGGSVGGKGGSGIILIAVPT